MNNAQMILFGLLLLAATFTVQTLVLVYGWGLSPQNWTVIISGWCFGVLLLMVKGSK